MCFPEILKTFSDNPHSIPRWVVYCICTLLIIILFLYTSASQIQRYIYINNTLSNIEEMGSLIQVGNSWIKKACFLFCLHYSRRLKYLWFILFVLVQVIFSRLLSNSRGGKEWSHYILKLNNFSFIIYLHPSWYSSQKIIDVYLQISIPFLLNRNFYPLI